MMPYLLSRIGQFVNDNREALAVLAGVLALLTFALDWHYSEVREAVDKVKAENAIATQVALAEAIAKVKRIEQINQEIQSAHKETIENLSKDAIRLRNELRGKRVCIDSTSYRNSVPEPASAARSDHGATDRNRFHGTIADDLATYAEQCQLNTEKLIALQAWVKEANKQ